MPFLLSRRFPPALAGLVILLGVALCGGCAGGTTRGDPFEPTNRFIYNVNEGLDKVALKPVSDLYTKVVPAPIRTGIGNGFDNLVYFNVIANDLLQAKWNQALGDSGRMAVNTTVGIAGIFDVATPWGLPAHQNDFGVTLAKWGASQGPYLVLPLFGPSTARDAPGLLVEYLATPTTYFGLPAKIWVPLDATQLIDARSRADFIVRFRNNTALDPYVFTRDAYLQYREARIRDGKPAPATSEPSIFDQDLDTGPTSAPTTGPTSAPATTAPLTRVSERFSEQCIVATNAIREGPLPGTEFCKNLASWACSRADFPLRWAAGRAGPFSLTTILTFSSDPSKTFKAIERQCHQSAPCESRLLDPAPDIRP